MDTKIKSLICRISIDTMIYNNHNIEITGKIENFNIKVIVKAFFVNSQITVLVNDMVYHIESFNYSDGYDFLFSDLYNNYLDDMGDKKKYTFEAFQKIV